MNNRQTRRSLMGSFQARRSRARHARGITLLEVMATIGVLMLGVAATSTVVLNTRQSNRRTLTALQAQLIAEQALEDITAMGCTVNPPCGNILGMDNRRYTVWQTVAGDLQEAEPPADSGAPGVRRGGGRGQRGDAGHHRGGRGGRARGEPGPGGRPGGHGGQRRQRPRLRELARARAHGPAGGGPPDAGGAMKRAAMPPRGFTLLEVMVSTAIGAIVLVAALAVGVQLQRRALFEEQTMMTQTTGRAVKDTLMADLQRAGLGMGNAPITFADGDTRFALQVWTEPDLSEGLPPTFPADDTFAPPPEGTPYENLRSDVLQLYWGDTRNMVIMDACNGKTVIREGNSFTFCTAPNPPTGMEPPNGQSTPAIIVNPMGNVACHLEISRVMENAGKLNANPGSAIGNTGAAPCGDPDDPIWEDTGWMTLRTQGAAWRVNWASGTPTLEYRPVGAAAWVTVSRDVERMKVRQAVIDLANPNAAFRWFPGRLRRPPRHRPVHARDVRGRLGGLRATWPRRTTSCAACSGSGCASWKSPWSSAPGGRTRRTWTPGRPSPWTRRASRWMASSGARSPSG
ncbi:prepilin-type N-terminal cleavage/methylation domain-containing protein [Pyxidicoccus sp. 3LG]